jgi:hypothetical protein
MDRSSLDDIRAASEAVERRPTREVVATGGESLPRNFVIDHYYDPFGIHIVESVCRNRVLSL